MVDLIFRLKRRKPALHLIMKEYRMSGLLTAKLLLQNIYVHL